jgi:hypothetical protein
MSLRLCSVIDFKMKHGTMCAMASGGVSFIVRVRNEEARLEGALTSLLSLSIPHDIVVICHMCTDGSRDVAERAAAAGQPVRVFEYTHDISRAGFETLVTPADHPASFVTYMNWCYEKARYKWVFKWDADFIASMNLLHFLNNELLLDDMTPTSYKIGVQLTPTIVNTETYLLNCLVTFKKHVFWELVEMTPNTQKAIPHRIYSIPPTVLKEYWLQPPWFTLAAVADAEDAEDAKAIQTRYDALVRVCGEEPKGLARASNPECNAMWRTLMAHRGKLESEHGVAFFA